MPALPAAHLPPQGSTLRDRDWGQAYRLTEAPPVLDLLGLAPPPDPALTLALVSWLGVERHARWRPHGGTTYCNVYAHDLCSLLGAYLPRVWWTSSAARALAAGVDVRPIYLSTVAELSANALFRWLEDHSSDFGWRPASLDDAQDAANRGRAAVICARNAREAAPGHISVIVPESPRCSAVRDDRGLVTVPVQSQAGGRNVEVGALPNPGRWWASSSFPAWGCWVHGADEDTPLPDTEPETPTGKSNPRMPAIDPGTGAEDWRPATDARPFLETLIDDDEKEKRGT